VAVKRRVALNQARSEVAGSLTNVILPSTVKKIVSSSHHVCSRQGLSQGDICEQLKVGNNDEIFLKSVERQLEAHIRETRSSLARRSAQLAYVAYCSSIAQYNKG